MVEHYYKHHGLQFDPFPLDQDDELYFLTPELQHRLELIKHLIEFSDRFLVVNGSPGSGKTALVRHLLKSIDDNWRVCQIPVREIHSSDDFFQELFEKQGLDYQSSEPLARKLAILHEHFLKLHENDFFPVLIIDDGQCLSIELLKILIDLVVPDQLEGGNNPALRIVFVSDTDLTELVSHKNMAFIHSIDVPPLSQEQTVQYLDFRLKAAGYDEAEPLISEKLQQQIYQTSNGLPGHINNLAVKALSDPAVIGEEKKFHWRDMATVLFNARYTIPAALIITAVFVVYILQMAESPSETEISRTEVTIPAIEKTAVVEAEIIGEESELEEIQETALPDENEKVVLQVPDDPAGDLGDFDKLAEEVETVQESEAETPLVVANEPVQPENKIEINVQLPANEPATVNPTIEQAPSLIDSPTVEAEEAQPIEINTEPESPVTEEQQAVAIAEEIPVSIPKPLPEREAKTVMRNNDWLKKQSPSHYVLQLMGAHDEFVVTKFTALHPELRSEMARFRTVNQNKLWHVLVYGLYENRELAVAATASLPPKIRSMKPWPRKIDSIQKDLQ